MGDDTAIPVAALVAISSIIIGSIYAILGGYVIFSVNNSLPWQTVSPQAASAAQNAANITVTILGLDPTVFFIALALVIGSLLALAAWAIFGGQDSGYGSE